MITVQKLISLSGGKAPYEYQWSANDTCVSFSPATGTTDKDISTEITFTDESCITGSTITLSGTDADGCAFSEVISISNPCSTFVLNPITSSAPNTFSVSAASPQCGSVDFEWVYDTTLFDLAGLVTTSFTSQLVLDIKDNVPSLPSTSTIKVNASNCNECEKSVNYNYEFCIPSAPNLEVNLYKETATNLPVQAFVGMPISIPDPTGCNGYTFDWDTLSLDLPTNITASSQSDSEVNFIGSSTLSAGTYSGTYTVKTKTGITSSIGVITFILHENQQGETISAPNKTVNIDCSSNPGDVINISLQDDLVVQSGTTIDWSSFQLVTPPTPSSPSITLTTDSSTGKYVIAYEVPNALSSDSFSWIICDTDGICSTTTTYTVLDCIEAPTANDDSADVACGGIVNINLTLNDLGNGSPISNSSISITSSPSKGTLTTKSDGTVDYIANEGVSGTDTFKYTVKNAAGETSNEATVTVNIACSGSDTTVALCN